MAKTMYWPKMIESVASLHRIFVYGACSLEMGRFYGHKLSRRS